MGKAEADQARRELAHALNALDDGKALVKFGSTKILSALEDRSLVAGIAYDHASPLAWIAARHTLPGQLYDPTPEQRLRFAANMRKLAPVILELLLDK